MASISDNEVILNNARHPLINENCQFIHTW